PGGGHTGCRAGRGERFCGGGAPGRLGSAELGRSSCLGGNTAALVECRGTGTSGWGGGGGGRWITAGGAIAGALGSGRFRRAGSGRTAGARFSPGGDDGLDHRRSRTRT